MNQPYRENVLALPPAPYKHSFWMRIKRVLQRWHITSLGKGSFCKRNPWPCLKCGKRTTAHTYIAYGGYYSQDMVEHACCGSYSDASKGSGFHYPYSRQLQRRLNAQSVMEDQHAAGGNPLRKLRDMNPMQERAEHILETGNAHYEENDWQ